MSLETALGGLILGSLVVYALTGGADFGAGTWDLLASGPRRARQRELVERAIAPIWEADHVWLIAAIVLLFGGLPRAFALVSTWLHLPLALMLLGVVLRGSAFVFRAYGSPGAGPRRFWGGVFSAASVLTPWTLGVCAASIAGGLVPAPGAEPAWSRFLAWAAPFPAAVGLLAWALFAHLAAVYLCLETDEAGLRDDFRARALASGVAAGAAAWLCLALAERDAPEFARRLTREWWSPAFHAATAAAAMGALWSLWARRYAAARVLAASLVALVVIGWGLAQYPHAVPPHLTLAEAAAPPSVLKAMLWSAAAGLAAVVPAFLWLFRIFKRSALRRG